MRRVFGRRPEETATRYFNAGRALANHIPRPMLGFRIGANDTRPLFGLFALNSY